MATIDAVIARAAAQVPDHIAVREWKGREMSYADLDTAVSRFAAWAQERGVREGDSIAIHLPNSLGYLVSKFGSFRAGGVAAYINYRLTTKEAVRQIRLCEARIIVTTAAKAAKLRACPELQDLVFLVYGQGESGHERLEDVMASERVLSSHPVEREDSDAIIRFTSGSTGEPKGLIVTHRAWLMRAVSMLVEEMQIREGSTTLVLGQLTHQAGLFVIPTFLRGGTLLLLEKFSLEALAEILLSTQVSCMQFVPTMFTLALSDSKARAALEKSKPGRIVYGGSPIRQSVLEEALALLPDTEFVQSYGSHEAGSISYLDNIAHRDPALRNGAGTPLLAVQVRVANVNADGVGEIHVNSPWAPVARLTAAGREAIKDAWSQTGDLGILIDGHVFLRDRMNDVIISGGFNVYPVEVEKVIGAHPSVLDVAVASAPDEKWGERVIAFIVKRTGAEVSEDALREFCRTQLAGYKVPKEFKVIDEMPLNPNGKPDRRRLSQSLWADRERRIH